MGRGIKTRAPVTVSATFFRQIIPAVTVTAQSGGESSSYMGDYIIIFGGGARYVQSSSSISKSEYISIYIVLLHIHSLVISQGELEPPVFEHGLKCCR